MNSLDHLGIGVFETFRATRTGDGRFAVTALDRHLERLKAGAFVASIPLPEAATLIEELRAKLAGAADDVKVRIIARRSGVEISAEAFQPSDLTVSVCPVAAERVLPEIKSCSALASVLAREAAERCGFFEAILVNRNGIATEGAWSNFFWLGADAIWRTPKTSILPGVTRSIALELIEGCLEVDTSWDQISKTAQACFLTQATNGLVPVDRIETRSVDVTGSQEIQATFKSFRAKYQMIL